MWSVFSPPPVLRLVDVHSSAVLLHTHNKMESCGSVHKHHLILNTNQLTRTFCVNNESWQILISTMKSNIVTPNFSSNNEYVHHRTDFKVKKKITSSHFSVIFLRLLNKFFFLFYFYLFFCLFVLFRFFFFLQQKTILCHCSGRLCGVWFDGKPTRLRSSLFRYHKILLLLFIATAAMEYKGVGCLLYPVVGNKVERATGICFKAYHDSLWFSLFSVLLYFLFSFYFLLFLLSKWGNKPKLSVCLILLLPSHHQTETAARSSACDDGCMSRGTVI